MAANFLHGIESIEVDIGPQAVTVVKSAVIGLVGTAPTWSGPAPSDAVSRAVWQPGVNYYVGQSIIDSNNNVQQVTQAGQSGASAPAFNATLGQNTSDGPLLVWKNVGVFSGKTIPAWETNPNAPWPLWNADAAYVVGDCVVDANGNLQQAIVSGASGGSAPSWATTFGTTTVDNTVTWKYIETAEDLAYDESLQLVNGIGDAENFGVLVRGYTIPYALQAIQNQGAGQVIVVNVFDRVQHVTQVTDESHVFPAAGVQTIFVGHRGISNVVLVCGLNTGVLGQDFTINAANGTISLVAGSVNFPTGSTCLVTYEYATPSLVTDQMIIGLVGPDGNPPAAGTFFGLQMLPLSMSKFGFNPKILVTPGFSQHVAVADALEVMATKLKAITYVDTDIINENTDNQTPSVQQAIANRGDTSKVFGIADRRVVPVYPRARFVDLGVDPQNLPINNPSVEPYSAFYAGATAAKDLSDGYWVSPSNTTLVGVLGPDVHIVMSAFDPNSDTNNLNAAGIATMFSAFGTGLRTWGNRSSAYPAATTPDVFIPIRRTLDIVEESLELFTLQFLDGPITNGLIQAILQSGNAFIRLQIQRGALEPGSQITYDPTKNPAQEIANGHLVFTLDCMPPPPAEWITFDVKIDTTLLSALTGTISGAQTNG